VAESVRPFKIVEDRGFLSLMKTGRPEYYVPSAATVSKDVQLVFGRSRERIAKMLQVRDSSVVISQDLIKDLQEYEGKISFATDAWTLPNHYAYVAVTAHFEVKGEPICIVLDVVELPVVRPVFDPKVYPLLRGASVAFRFKYGYRIS
jgi:hypothetical protein